MIQNVSFAGPRDDADPGASSVSEACTLVTFCQCMDMMAMAVPGSKDYTSLKFPFGVSVSLPGKLVSALCHRFAEDKIVHHGYIGIGPIIWAQGDAAILNANMCNDGLVEHDP